jgi:hypothetical protein
MSDERIGWAVKDAAIVRELRELMGLSAEQSALLKGLQDAARQTSGELIDEFYERLLAHEFTSEFITDQKRLAGTLADWFCELFCGNYDDEYALKRLKIGLVHVRIGLPVRYPLAMLDVIAKHGEKVAASAGAEAVTAFRKVLALDVATFNQAYENNQLHHLAELTGSERLARRLLSGA